ncbi:5-formyltetrahydrofolate cyclo-ligase [Psychrobacter sp. HD31]|uniref:5-formyltetrahydrofolate cyclo-ligase n=1 Tax=Psychrobacter sp. HD31 TaxID=3112003 RepID=UPI003DA543A9
MKIQTNLYVNRKYITSQRRALSPHQRQNYAQQASLHLHKLQHILPNSAKVGIYYHGFGEQPTQPILNWCWRMGFTPFLPVVGSLGQHNKQLRFSPVNRKKLHTLPTYKHRLGMKQHRHSVTYWAEQLDAIFCPLVAVDKKGTRLGMGGGFYDVTLAKTHRFNLKTPLKIAWCYDFQVMEELNRQPWDVPMDMALTPNRLIRF